MAKPVPYGAASSKSFQQLTNSNPNDINLNGCYIGIVKGNVDHPDFMGTLTVLIPKVATANGATLDVMKQVRYMTPFYGTKSPNAVGDNSGDQTTYSESPHSYGMWFTPPDIDTQVICVFANGQFNQGFWIGCIPEPYINNMVPGIAASTNAALPGNDKSGNTVNQIYGTDSVPAGEINRDLLSSNDKTTYDSLPRPIHPFAETLRKQGLITDTVRGTTTSSARRESPSAVFGISTPGRVDPAAPKSQLGPTDNLQVVSTTRTTGHTFVMDDGDANGNNQLVRLRTASGHQLLMNDTAGVVYIANGSGNVWMEFSKDGTVDVYSALGYNLRSGGDINFHSEGNINMYANGNIRIKANQHRFEKDAVNKGIISIDGSVINQIASQQINNTVINGSYALYAGTDIVSQANTGLQVHQSGGQTHLIGEQVHFNSIPPIDDLVRPLTRTAFGTATGTGTAETTYPDVTPILTGAAGILKTDRNIPGMTGMHVPTHEPYQWHSDYTRKFPVGPYNPDDANTPGTDSWQIAQNLNSSGPIQDFQILSLIENNLQTNLTSTSDISQAQLLNANYIQNLPNLFPGVNFNLSPLTAGGVAGTVGQNLQSLIPGSNTTSANINLISGTTLNTANGQILFGSPNSVIPGIPTSNLTAQSAISLAQSKLTSATGVNAIFNLQSLEANAVNSIESTAINTATNYAKNYITSTEAYQAASQYITGLQKEASSYLSNEASLAKDYILGPSAENSYLLSSNNFGFSSLYTPSVSTSFTGFSIGDVSIGGASQYSLLDYNNNSIFTSTLSTPSINLNNLLDTSGISNSISSLISGLGGGTSNIINDSLDFSI